MANYKNYIGWLVGSFVLFPILLHFYSIFSINKNDGKKHYQSYINNSIQIKTIIPIQLKFKGGSYRVSYSRFSSERGDIDRIIFFDKKQKKYLMIESFDISEMKAYNLSSILPESEVILYINQNDLTNPKYGTKENPVPIFNYKGVKKPIEVITQKAYNSTDSYMQSLEPTQQEYEHNVITYLTYIMPEKEFDERFSKIK